MNLSQHSHIPDDEIYRMEIDDSKDDDSKDDAAGMMEISSTSVSSLSSLSSRTAAEEYLRRQFGKAYSKQDSDSEIIVKMDNTIAEVNINTLVNLLFFFFVHVLFFA